MQQCGGGISHLSLKCLKCLIAFVTCFTISILVLASAAQAAQAEKGVTVFRFGRAAAVAARGVDGVPRQRDGGRPHHHRRPPLRHSSPSLLQL